MSGVVCIHNVRLNHPFFPLSVPGKWQLCHRQPGGRMSMRKWWSCGPGSLHPPKALWPESGGTASESSASWPPTEKRCDTEYTVLSWYPCNPLSDCFIPAHAVAQQTEADSDSQGCMQTAHRPECRLRDRLWKFQGDRITERLHCAELNKSKAECITYLIHTRI